MGIRKIDKIIKVFTALICVMLFSNTCLTSETIENTLCPKMNLPMKKSFRIECISKKRILIDVEKGTSEEKGRTSNKNKLILNIIYFPERGFYWLTNGLHELYEKKYDGGIILYYGKFEPRSYFRIFKSNDKYLFVYVKPGEKTRIEMGEATINLIENNKVLE